MNSSDFQIEDELKKLPASPGVYIMHGQSDEIIYVGKAVSLKNRVRQYFRPGQDKRMMIGTMVPQITRFEVIVTDSELEALILECNLIKEHRPKYNTLLKDDKAYPFIRVTLEEDFPRVLFARNMKADGSRYFGPFSGAGAVKEAIELVRRLYQIRHCSLRIPGDKKARPCLYYHIGQCKAPCQGYITKEEYGESVKKALEFLSGDHRKIRNELAKSMQEASDELRFEEAAKLRDLIESIDRISETQKAASSPGEDSDIIAFARIEDDCVAQVFFLRDGKLLGREHYYLKAGRSEQNGRVCASFITQYYSGTPYIPKEVLVSDEPDDAKLLEAFLSDKRGSRVTINRPQRGRKARLTQLAQTNAARVLEQDRERLQKEEKSTRGAIEALGMLLDMDAPMRIEAYDISNISGYMSVGSMVVFENGRPKRQDYRKFRIKSVEGPNDYASLSEVLSRRFKRALEGSSGFDRLPDLILMDGGKGQVNVCEKVLEDLGLSVPVCGMVKDDRHRTRGLYCNNIEVPMDRSSEEFRLVTRIQDEAHRFAITYHRLLRSKGQTHSVLDDIPDIGEARKKELMRRYDGIDELKKADVDELKQLPGMNEKAARSVYEFFHKKEEA